MAHVFRWESTRAFAVPGATRTLVTLALSGRTSSSSAPSVGDPGRVVATFGLAAGLLGRQVAPIHYTD
jgi:hypothetical protein